MDITTTTFPTSHLSKLTIFRSFLTIYTNTFRYMYTFIHKQSMSECLMALLLRTWTPSIPSFHSFPSHTHSLTFSFVSLTCILCVYKVIGIKWKKREDEEKKNIFMFQKPGKFFNHPHIYKLMLCIIMHLQMY